jgi:hypothetical protein
VVTGRITVLLDVEPDTNWTRDRRQLAVLDRCPDGAEVLVDIGNRQHPTPDAAGWLCKHESRLAITISGSCPEAVSRFIHAARSGDVWGAA